MRFRFDLYVAKVKDNFSDDFDNFFKKILFCVILTRKWIETSFI